VSHTREGAQSKHFEEIPDQVSMFSSGLDKDFESCVNPVKQPSAVGGEEVVSRVVGDKVSLSKSADRSGNLDVTGNAAAARDVAMNKTEVAVDVRVLPESSTRSSPSPVPVLQENFSPTDRAARTTPTRSDQTGPLERSRGSSSDVSLSSGGLDQSSSSRMLTKRLPKVASRSGSRTGTPLTPSTQTSLPGRPSFSPSPVHSATGSRVASPGVASAGGNESYDCIPELRRETVPRPATISTNSRYLCNLRVIVFV